MSHEWTMKFVQHRVADKRVLRLIQKWLKAGVSEDGEWSETKVGTPQGAVVSPLLANVYLHYVFDLWVEAWRKKVADGEMIVVRYADDLVVGFEHRAEAERFLADFRERLAKFGLELHAEKTRLIEFGRFAQSNRQARGEGRAGKLHVSGVHALLRDQQGGVLYPSKANGAEAAGGEVAAGQANASSAHARAGAQGGGMAPTCAQRILPIPRGAGQLGQPEDVPAADRTLLAARPQTAQPTRTNHCGAHDSIIQPLAHSTPAGASLPQRPL